MNWRCDDEANTENGFITDHGKYNIERQRRIGITKLPPTIDSVVISNNNELE